MDAACLDNLSWTETGIFSFWSVNMEVMPSQLTAEVSLHVL